MGLCSHMASVPNHWAPKALLSLLIGRDELTKCSDLEKSTAVLPAFDHQEHADMHMCYGYQNTCLIRLYTWPYLTTMNGTRQVRFDIIYEFS